MLSSLEEAYWVGLNYSFVAFSFVFSTVNIWPEPCIFDKKHTVDERKSSE